MYRAFELYIAQIRASHAGAMASAMPFSLTGPRRVAMRGPHGRERLPQRKVFSGCPSSEEFEFISYISTRVKKMLGKNRVKNFKQNLCQNRAKFIGKTCLMSVIHVFNTIFTQNSNLLKELIYVLLSIVNDHFVWQFM